MCCWFVMFCDVLCWYDPTIAIAWRLVVTKPGTTAKNQVHKDVAQVSVATATSSLGTPVRVPGQCRLLGTDGLVIFPWFVKFTFCWVSPGLTLPNMVALRPLYASGSFARDTIWVCLSKNKTYPKAAAYLFCFPMKRRSQGMPHFPRYTFEPYGTVSKMTVLETDQTSNLPSYFVGVWGFKSQNLPRCVVLHPGSSLLLIAIQHWPRFSRDGAQNQSNHESPPNCYCAWFVHSLGHPPSFLEKEGWAQIDGARPTAYHDSCDVDVSIYGCFR